jgi:1,4-alpha-glucan branching enzyme
MRAFLIGDFNNWDRDATPMTKNDFGVFEVTVPGKDGKPSIPHDSKIKVRLLHSRNSVTANSSELGILRRPQ